MGNATERDKRMRAVSDTTKLRRTRHELKQAQTTLRLVRAELAQRRHWGQMMSTLCSSLAQNENYDVTHRQWMKDCLENWDKIKTVC